MLDASRSMTVQARMPNPYLHVDNRGLILCNGPRCVCVPQSQLRTCAETFEIIATEKRATRTQGQHLIGGYVLGFQEQSLVDSKDPDAKRLPVNKMMVHHFLYYTRGRVDPGPGGCLGPDFLSGRGEEHPNGRFDAASPPE